MLDDLRSKELVSPSVRLPYSPLTFIFEIISCDVLAVVRAEELRTELKESGVAEGRERADSAALVSSGARFGDHDVLFVAYSQYRSV